MQPNFVRYLKAFLVCIAFVLLSGTQSAPAQSITIRMLDGNSGKPFANKNVFVTFWWDDPSQPPGERRVRVGFPHDSGGTDIPLDSHGVASVKIPPQATMVEVQSVENVVIYGKRGQYLLCNATGNQFLSTTERFAGGHRTVPLNLVSTRGFVPETDCKPRKPVTAAPGEYVLLALPEHCWPLCGIVF